jgi:hypothetical protein
MTLEGTFGGPRIQDNRVKNKIGNRNGSKRLEQDIVKPIEHVVFKYSKDVPLAEEITLGANGKYVFLQILDGKPVISGLIDQSQEKNIIIKPHGQCLPIDNGSEKQTTDRKEIEGSTSPCDTGQENVERSLSSHEIITTSDEDPNHRQYTDPFGPSAHSFSPHIPQREPEKDASNSIIQDSAKHIRRLYEGSDIRVCEDCGRKGDRWEMEKHICRIY